MPPLLWMSPRSCLTLPTSLLPSSIPWVCKHTGASAVGDVHSDALYLLLPQLTPLLSSARPRAAYKHTGASYVGDVHSDALYPLLPKLTPPLFSLRPWANLPLPTPPLWSLIPKRLSLRSSSLHHCPRISDLSDTLSIPFPWPTPPLLSLILWDRQWKTTYLWIIDLVFILVTFCACDCWAWLSN